MNKNHKKAINWIKERLNEEDIKDFSPESHVQCRSLHHILKIYLRQLENDKGFVLENAYYQTKKLKDWYLDFKKN